MNDPQRIGSCEAIRPLLFAASEGEITACERLEVHAHLAVCDECRSWERGERALTALLVESSERPAARQPRRSRLMAIAAALLLVSTVMLVLPAATPKGSLVQRQLGPDRDLQVNERALRGQDVVEVPAMAAATVRLGENVTLDAVGPARFAIELVDGVWHVTVDSGEVTATVEKHAELGVGEDGAQKLAKGKWVLSRDKVARKQPVSLPPISDLWANAAIEQMQATQDPKRSPKQMIEEAIKSFYQAQPFPWTGAEQDNGALLKQSETLLRAALATTGDKPDLNREALFYLACTLSRQGREKESYDVETEYLRRYPKGSEADLVRFYQASYLRDIGEYERARALFQRVQKEGGASLQHAAESYLNVLERELQRDPWDNRAGDNKAGNNKAGGDKQQSSAASAADAPRIAFQFAWQQAVEQVAAKAGARSERGYLVVRVDLDGRRASDEGYAAAAADAQRFHGGNIVDWDGRDFGRLTDTLRQHRPENVLFVLRPAQLDLVLHRKLLMLSSRLDKDWFTDFSFGYLTGETGAHCEQLWQRIEGIHRGGKLSGTWWQASVASMDRSLAYQNACPPVAQNAGFDGPHYYYGTGDANSRETVDESLQTMQQAQVVEFTGCGDPQGIWLFSDRRNMQRDKHWDYAPDRVGHDPDNEMPRLMASSFRNLKLASPILWSGTCHSGAVNRVFVEGDIVSTFGRTEHATVHTLQPEESLALSWLHAGAASMLVPLGANHGMSVSMEVDYALRNGASLGETIKSTYDDVLLAAKGKLELDLPVDGQPHRSREPVMQGGGSNRILIGDPALRPFRVAESAAERVSIERTSEGLRVTIDRAEGWQPRSWDMFGQDRRADYRVVTKVDLTAVGIEQGAEFEATVRAASPDGESMRYALRRCVLEQHAGRRYLHLQANGTRQDLDRKAAKIVFDVTVR